MIFKKGVKINGVKPEVVMALIVCERIYDAFKAECVVTSIMDGKHSSGSLHYVGFAFDLRTRTFSNPDLVLIHKALKANLTDEFDVVLEKDHFHIEFQPKK